MSLDESEVEPEYAMPSSWAGAAGNWEFDGASAIYESPQEGIPFGLAVTDLSVRTGWVETDITLSNTVDTGRIVFGRDPTTQSYYSAGIGGEQYAYVIYHFTTGLGWFPLILLGASSNLAADEPYHVEVYVEGQHAWLKVDDVDIASVVLPTPLGGEQVGVFAWGSGETRFENVRALPEMPRAFVVMQFGEPYDAIYTDVIAPVSVEMGFEAMRADDVHAPGVILQDIIANLLSSEVVIVEISEENPNVFYELGYAHGLGKPTILLADKDRQLPFDVSGYRVIFYDNTIGGKQAVENDLQKHLASITRNT